MKAIVYTEYGSPDVLQLKEVEKPTPRDNEVLIKIHAVSLNRSDWEALIGRPLYARMGGLRKPGHPILGSDVAGRVEQAGKDIQHFKVGDEVFGETMRYSGGFAEYVCAPETVLSLKPASLTFEQAAAIPQAGGIALQGICTKGHVQPGQKVLINGAGGGGTFAIQLAKLHGAEVTGVDNTGKLEFMRSVGADHVIDYTREDFTKTGKQYDLILDLVAHRSPFACARALRKDGTYFFVGGSVAALFQILLFRPFIKRSTGKNVRLLVVQPNRADLVTMIELYEAGKIVPMIDKVYRLEKVPDGLRYLGEGRAKGKVLITVA